MRRPKNAEITGAAAPFGAASTGAAAPTGAATAPTDAAAAPPGEILIELDHVTFSYSDWYNRPQEQEQGRGPESAQAATPQAATQQAAPAQNATQQAAPSQTAAPAQDAESQPRDTDLFDRDNAVEDVSMCIRRGEFVVFLGRNGSGKSTLAKLLNALLLPSGGVVRVKGAPTSDPGAIWEIRRTAGIVFQNPDNQIVGTTVEEDVAFGVENLGVPTPEIRRRIDGAMAATGVADYAERPPYQLSGGQKQRVAIAGILAMRPECIILDEATAMLDPDGRREVLGLVRRLNREEGIAVVLITHHMDEVALADRVIVVDGGRAILDLPPKELFSDAPLIRGLGLDVPQITEVFELLRERGINLPRGVVGVDEAFGAIKAFEADRAFDGGKAFEADQGKLGGQDAHTR
ncbi:MAG: energy-coupling factor transporter ATPase [Clostridiales bacterium]|jgi:energy-coupling factor transport system ATP-binding protein|nr:energy-coupling factor transporter ATPase [Clostridiales bacterium]